MNLYDFDKTIYNGDSPPKFYLFCLRRHPKIWWHPFSLAFWSIMAGLKIINLSKFKERFISFILYLPDYKKDLEKFWEKEIKNIFSWYYEKRQPDDVICSATPRFMMNAIIQKINPTATLVCSEIDDKTARYLPDESNCRGENKATKLRALGFESFENGFGDSLLDVPMLRMCNAKFRVKRGKVFKFPDKYFK